LVVGFAPWSAFLGLALWYSLRFQRRNVGCVESSKPTEATMGLVDSTLSTTPPTRPGERLAITFLWCWIVVYFAFFSISQTKLPNYILPIYPAVALMTARFLECWRRGQVHPPAWTMHVAPICLALLGVGTVIALPMLGGVVPARFLGSRTYPGIEKWAGLGLLPLAGAVATWRCIRRGERTAMVASFTASAVAFLAVVAAGVGVALEP